MGRLYRKGVATQVTLMKNEDNSQIFCNSQSWGFCEFSLFSSRNTADSQKYACSRTGTRIVFFLVWFARMTPDRSPCRCFDTFQLQAKNSISKHKFKAPIVRKKGLLNTTVSKNAQLYAGSFQLSKQKWLHPRVCWRMRIMVHRGKVCEGG